jgi:DNA-binding transcriptional ArsR family regulator
LSESRLLVKRDRDMMKTGTREADLLDEELLARASDTFRVLSHPARLRIVEFLMSEEISVCELAERLELPQATLSQHLNRLRASGVITGERRGQKVFYRVVSHHAHSIIAALHRGGCSL